MVRRELVPEAVASKSTPRNIFLSDADLARTAMSPRSWSRVTPGPRLLLVALVALAAVVVTPTGALGSHVAVNSIGAELHAAPNLASPRYNVTFTETGLPSNARSNPAWYVILGWWFSWAPASPVGLHSIRLTGVTAGDWPLLLSGSPGYVAAGGVSSTLDISGSHYNLSYNVSFVPGRTADLYWSEKGLPANLGVDSPGWCVNWSFWPAPFSCSGLPLNGILNLPLGDYSYQVTHPTVGQVITAKIGKTPVPANGTLALTSNTQLKFLFVYRYAVTFTESGLPPGTAWSLTVKGEAASPRSHLHVSEQTVNSTVTLWLPNGTYHFRVGAVTGFLRTPAVEPLPVNGAALSYSITFRPKS